MDKIISPYGGDREDRLEAKPLETAYFFGMFYMIHLYRMIKKMYGMQRAEQFMDKKFKDLAWGNPDFKLQLEKNLDKVKQYYSETMDMRTQND